VPALSDAIHTVRSRPTARLQLFCFAHAGAAGTVYSGFDEKLGDEVEVCAVTLPGRGALIDDQFAEEWPSLVAHLAGSVEASRRGPVALLGHSLGATLAFEVGRALAAAGDPPVRLFLSAPTVLGGDGLLHGDGSTITDEQVLEMIKELAGEMSPDLATEPEVVAFFSAVIRADYALAARYEGDRGEPLPVPATILLGEDDPGAVPWLVSTWRRRLSLEIDVHTFPGGHLFLFSESHADALRLVELRLGEILAELAGDPSVNPRPSRS
jgi:surfactin synthase thioesterase subunit